MDKRQSSRVVGAAAVMSSCALVLMGVANADSPTTRTVACHGAGGGVAGLRAAIKTANAHGGGQITLAKNCTYTFSDGPYKDRSGGNALPIITSSIVIMGNQSTLTRQSHKRFRFFEVSDRPGAGLELHDATLTGGHTSSDARSGVNFNGGAIFTLGHLVLRHAKLNRNVSGNGGAVEADGGTVRITESTLVRNHARDVPGATAGAVAVNGARVTLRRVTLARNDAVAKGGAIAVFAGAVRISESTLARNTVSVNGAGGGIFNFGELTIKRSTLADNQANGYGGNGGAIANYNQGQLTVTESEITGNSAGMKRGVSRAFGGGIANFGAADLAKVKITGNSALGGKAKGGGISVQSGALSIVKSTVSGNSPNNCSGQVQGRC